MASTLGRPRLASREMLQEAAFELFQLQGYRNTSVEQIAKTAGFSRATFFNFFSSKAELFWVETDALVASLSELLDARAHDTTAPTTAEVMLEFAAGLSSADIPWALQNYRLIEAADDLVASGAGRVLELNRLFVRYLRATHATSNVDEQLRLHAEAASLTSRLLVALVAWIDAGVNRADLASYLRSTL